MHFSPVSLYCGPFGGPTYNLGPKYALFTSQLVLWTIWWVNLESGAKICTFHQSACTWDHLVCQPRIWGQNMHFSPVSLYCGPFGGPTYNLGPKYALFTSQPVLWTIWWVNIESGPKICTFHQSACTVDHLVSQPRIWGQNMHFSPVSLYCGPFGGPT
jgi:hypothetical protein